METTIVVALGGNALGNNLIEQRINVAKAAVSIADLIEAGYRVAICHGNGPQVGMINLAFETAAKTEPTVHPMPLSTDSAMSQGYIGFGIQKALYGELAHRKIKKSAATIITQVVVDASDPSFTNPTKPIGSFYTEDEALFAMKAFPEIIMKEDAGRGWRRVVASPEPKEIIESQVISSMIDAGHIVIAVGGGGLPVTRTTDGALLPAECVIDKDFASALMAEMICADIMLILTAVDQVSIGFGTARQKDLDKISVAEATRYIEQGEFAAGSMLPKVQAALKFVKARPQSEVLITSLDRAMEALLGITGTRIVA